MLLTLLIEQTIQKKYLSLIALLGLWGLGCQKESVNESLATDQPVSVSRPDSYDTFTRVPLTAIKICNSSVGQGCLPVIQRLESKLMSLDVIPIPKEGISSRLSVRQATEHYRAFLAVHKGEPITSVFRQVYARVLLNQYGVLDGKDYALIGFIPKS